ncbi:ImmA/IrrE family metallo-endopeptidase [Clostridium cadaveris]|uniref:ImmA/IrrE family metallo-endopeptidase n=1 Tax=Clostridium cadaveris TaxID=1529 RepID=UPI001E4ECC1E|nr:ImmA/IrrE family metallo-endopeptidase [Clostridium cadaveris]UFH65556.1 ImmA/IrrE family metallo-endopeptidase [Clostridium cadaveris]
MNTYIKRVINDLKEKYKTNDPFELANCLDVVLVTQPLGSIYGMYKYIKRNKVIYLNSNLDDCQKRFVLAHELGHCVLHTKSTCFFTSIGYINKGKKEYEANLFAAEFLIYDVDPIILEGYSINQLAAYYEVPSELIELKRHI